MKVSVWECDDYDVSWEIVCLVSGKYRPPTWDDPAEYPEVEVIDAVPDIGDHGPLASISDVKDWGVYLTGRGMDLDAIHEQALESASGDDRW